MSVLTGWIITNLDQICPPTLEALVAMCNGKGALLHGQLVKFGELLKQWRKEGGEYTNTDRHYE